MGKAHTPKLKLPSNTEAVVLVLDREHVDLCGAILHNLGNLKNPALARTLALWQQRLDAFPFFAMGGSLAREGAVGGLAATWEQALQVISMIKHRLDEESGAGFSSAWLLS